LQTQPHSQQGKLVSSSVPHRRQFHDRIKNGALSFPAEHNNEDFSVRYKKWCPPWRAIDQNVTPRKTLLPSAPTMFSQGISAFSPWTFT
jgi:hypothetical protein